MTRFTPFLGETHDRDAAVPGIDGRPIQWHYNKATMPRRLPCANRMCRDGGIDLQHFISTCGPGEYQFFCEGYEGSRERGRPRVTAAGTDSGSERQIVWPSTA